MSHDGCLIDWEQTRNEYISTKAMAYVLTFVVAEAAVDFVCSFSSFAHAVTCVGAEI